jgi:hypothetical protein
LHALRLRTLARVEPKPTETARSPSVALVLNWGADLFGHCRLSRTPMDSIVGLILSRNISEVLFKPLVALSDGL